MSKETKICKYCKQIIPKEREDNWTYSRRVFCDKSCYSAWRKEGGLKGHKGHKQSSKTKEKIRKAMKGRKITWAYKLKGKVCSPETRAKIRKAHLGRKTSDATKEKQRQAKLKNPTQMFGSANPMWKGGPSKKKYLRDELKTLGSYKLWHKAVFMRDCYTCQDCGNKGIFLNVHHIVPLKDIFVHYHIETLDDALSCQPIWNISNGLTLCVECHKKRHASLKGRKKKK